MHIKSSTAWEPPPSPYISRAAACVGSKTACTLSEVEEVALVLYSKVKENNGLATCLTTASFPVLS